jgi:hypothetical protein
VEELLPYRDQFLAAGLAVTSTDQKSPKGKEKALASTAVEPSNHGSHRPNYTQLDGSPRGKDLSTSSSPSSGETFIHFNDNLDPAALALIEELPEPKRKDKNPREKVQSRWFHRKAHPVTEGQPETFKETIFTEKTKPSQHPTEPSSSKRTASPGAPELRERSSQREPKVLEGTGQSAPVPVHVPRPARQREAKKPGKLPQLPEDLQWRKPTQPDRAPPPVPPKVAAAAEKPAVAHGHTHRPSGIRPAGSTAAAPLRSKSPSHVRNRHAPLAEPTMKHRLSTPFEQPTDVVMVKAGHPGDHGHHQTQDTVSNLKTRRSKEKACPTLPAIVKDNSTQPTDVLILSAGHPGHHGPPPFQHDDASANRVLQDKANSISPTPPTMVQHTGNSAPELPMTWKYAVGTPSSFEQALDDVVRKLDAMEPNQSMPQESKTGESSKPRPQQSSPERHNIPVQYLDEAESHLKKLADKASELLETTVHDIHSQLHKAPAKAPFSPDSKLKRAKAVRHLRNLHHAEQSPRPEASQKPESAPTNPVIQQPVPARPELPLEPEKKATQKKDNRVASLSVEDKTVDRQDRDINDRDVLKGLKLAVSAACDENLDFWIRQKTGLRLRRFLADLKTFEDLESPKVESVDDNTVDKKKGPKTGRDGADEEEAGLGDNEADPDDDHPRAKGMREVKRRVEQDRERASKRKQV